MSPSFDFICDTFFSFNKSVLSEAILKPTAHLAASAFDTLNPINQLNE